MMTKQMEDEVTPEIIGDGDLEKVNRHLLERLDTLILSAKSGEEILSLTEAVAKFNSSIRNNAIFSEEETLSQKLEQERKATVAEILNKS